MPKWVLAAVDNRRSCKFAYTPRILRIFAAVCVMKTRARAENEAGLAASGLESGQTAVRREGGGTPMPMAHGDALAVRSATATMHTSFLPHRAGKRFSEFF